MLFSNIVVYIDATFLFVYFALINKNLRCNSLHTVCTISLWFNVNNEPGFFIHCETRTVIPIVITKQLLHTIYSSEIHLVLFIHENESTWSAASLINEMYP